MNGMNAYLSRRGVRSLIYDPCNVQTPTSLLPSAREEAMKFHSRRPDGGKEFHLLSAGSLIASSNHFLGFAPFPVALPSHI